MDYGELKNYFRKVCVKTLAGVDVDSNLSNQHEFNGTRTLKEIFGPDRQEHIPARFLYLCDEEDPVESAGFLSWYDARENHPTRSEYRLYYSDNDVTQAAGVGDEMFITISADDDYQVIVAKKDSAIASQLDWLFGARSNEHEFSEAEMKSNRIGAEEAFILDLLGIKPAIDKSADQYLDAMQEAFGGKFPTTKEFSAFVSSTLPDIDFASDDPDEIIVQCYNQEEMLFRAYEELDITKRLQPIIYTYIETDKIETEEVIDIAKSVLNRRKSRAGKALENHLEEIFCARGISFTAQAVLGKEDKPDFLFPSEAAYKDPSFPVASLTMLAAKTTAKERWRQVLDEAGRIKHKHLIVLEPAISEAVTTCMREKMLQLVVPTATQSTYKSSQVEWLWSLSDFCHYVEEKQSRVCLL